MSGSSHLRSKRSSRDSLPPGILIELINATLQFLNAFGDRGQTAIKIGLFLVLFGITEQRFILAKELNCFFDWCAHT